MTRAPKLRVRAVHPADDSFGYLGDVLVDGDRLYATGGTYHKPTLLVSEDGAQSWRRLTPPLTPGLRTLSKQGHALYLCGEYGTLAVSVDSGLTWTTLPVGTSTCLFELARTPDGIWWVCGDDGVILRSTDGVAFQPIEVETATRFLGIRIVDGIVHVLGYDGDLRRWNGTAFETVSVCGSPLTDLIVTRAGTWLVSGDGGTVYRSTDRGQSWEEVSVPTGEDLESMIETPQGILIVGNNVVLFSADDGKTFGRVPTDLEGHLWTIVAYGNTYVVSGDEGAIWTVDVSATETVEMLADDDEEDDDDDDDDEAPAPVTFASIEQASERWIREGTAFSDALNEYVRKVYSVGPNKAGHEPSETRQDMADYVREQLVALNAQGQHQRARRLFPPAYEPFDYDALGQSIHTVGYLRDGRRLASIRGEVFELGADKITRIGEADELMGFGQSFDRRWVCKEYADRLDIHDGWDGPRAHSFPALPGELASITVAPEGNALLVAGDDGIHWITASGAKRLLPDEEADNVSYPHAALSPNGRFVAMGTQDSSHIVVDRKTGRRHLYNPISSYPHYAAFHHDRPEVVLSSCHGLYGSGSLLVDLDAAVAGKTKSSRALDERAWVYCVATTSTGYLLGDRSGYIWAFDFEAEQQWYCFLGSTLTAMAISPDRKKLLVGSYAGLIVELDLGAAKPDPRLLTNGPVQDVARWVFWQGHPPLIW